MVSCRTDAPTPPPPPPPPPPPIPPIPPNPPAAPPLRGNACDEDETAEEDADTDTDDDDDDDAAFGLLDDLAEVVGADFVFACGVLAVKRVASATLREPLLLVVAMLFFSCPFLSPFCPSPSDYYFSFCFFPFPMRSLRGDKSIRRPRRTGEWLTGCWMDAEEFEWVTPRDVGQ